MKGPETFLSNDMY